MSENFENRFHLGLLNFVNFFEGVIFILSMFKVMSKFASSTGYLLGGHVVRFFHGHDECLTIPSTDQNDSQHK